MDHQEKSLRIGAVVILCAVVLRLGGAGIWQRGAEVLCKPNIQSFLIYLETGRIVRFSPSLADSAESVGESPAPVVQPTEALPQALPVFSEADLDLVELTYSCGLRPDTEQLLTQPLQWDLTGDKPTVLILHTHATESYTKTTENYSESSAFRTLDEHYNMVSIGERVADILEEAGITVIHDRSLHDYPSYTGSYNQARKSIQSWLAEYPSIRLVLDLHRDASGDLNNQFRPVVTLDGVETAKIMLVMGTNASGLKHPDWKENLSLGLKLQAQLERQAPGITRPISLRSQRFNQDLTPGSLLIEMGAAGNTHAEALRAAEQLAKAIIALSRGTGE
jgi:stage II sporulation protein P